MLRATEPVCSRALRTGNLSSRSLLCRLPPSPCSYHWHWARLSLRTSLELEETFKNKTKQTKQEATCHTSPPPTFLERESECGGNKCVPRKVGGSTCWLGQRQKPDEEGRIRLQAMGSSGRGPSRGVTGSDTSLRISGASTGTAARRPSPSPGHHSVSLTPLIWSTPRAHPQGSACPCFQFSPPTTPHGKVHPAHPQGWL